MSPVVPNSGKNKNGDIKKTVPASSSDVNQIKFNQYIDTVSIKKDHICNSLENRIEKNSAVLLHFTLTLEDGSIAESSRLSGKPALFCLGNQSLSDMLEAQLLGLKVNDKKKFTLPAVAAFGEKNPDLIQYFSREDFSNIGLPEVGAVILFTAINGREMPGIVYEVMAESITVDFNHPLAGHSVNFDIEILKIDPQDGKKMKILLANPRGFCAGVYRAISIVESALKIYGPPIYVRHEVVHNRYVVEDLRKRGAIFIEHISQVPDGSVLIFSAHGVSQAVKAQAKARQLKILFDATCPLVTKVHMEVLRASRKGQEAILIGHAGHPEVEGTMGQYDNASAGIYLVESVEDVNQLKVKDENNLCFMTQTTLSVDDTLEITSALQKRFPKIIGPRKDDICYATTNRQQAVRELSEKSDMVLVVGSKNSSNSNRLAELAKRMGKPAYLIDSDADIHADWLKNIKYIGVTAGASAPDVLVQKVIITLQSLGADESIEMMGQEENIVFEIPKQLRIHATEISCS